MIEKTAMNVWVLKKKERDMKINEEKKREREVGDKMDGQLEKSN